MYKVVS